MLLIRGQLKIISTPKLLLYSEKAAWQPFCLCACFNSTKAMQLGCIAYFFTGLVFERIKISTLLAAASDAASNTARSSETVGSPSGSTIASANAGIGIMSIVSIAASIAVSRFLFIKAIYSSAAQTARLRSPL